MSNFVRLFLMMMGVIGLLMVTVGVSLLFMLKQSGVLPQKLRAYVLTSEDEKYLAERDRREDEPPSIDPEGVHFEMERNFKRLADHLNETTVRELMENLSQREQELRERADHLDQREAELRMHKAELARLERQFVKRKDELNKLLQRLEQERERWAVAKVQEQQQLQVLRQAERQQWEQVAKRYELMKKPWELMRELEVNDIAMILALMDGKKAAKILDSAVKDPTAQDLPIQIHRRLLNIDVDGLSGDQAERLAKLYNFMKASQVVTYLGGSPANEMARIIALMDMKKGKTVLEELQKIDPDRALEVQRLLKPGGGQS